MGKKQENKEIELVVQSNSLIEAQYKLSAFSQLLLRKMISLIKPSDTHFKKSFYRISVSEIAELTGRRKDSVYGDIKSAATQLLRTIVSVPKPKNQWLYSTWVASMEYHRGEGWFEFEFSQKLETELLKLKKEFTKYYLKNISQLNSQYSIRIYELLRQYVTLQYRRIELLELRKILGIDDTQYKQFNDFKRKVLNKAQKEICEKTDICFTWEPFKTGRKITAIDFNISKVMKKREKINSIPENILTLIPKDYQDSVKDLCLEILNKEEEDCLIWIIEYVNNKKDHKNYGGYLRFAYQNKLYNQSLEQKKLEEQYLTEQKAFVEARKRDQSKKDQAEQEAIKREAHLNKLIDSLSAEEKEELNNLALQTLESEALESDGANFILNKYNQSIREHKYKKAINSLYRYRLKLIEDFKSKKGDESIT